MFIALQIKPLTYNQYYRSSKNSHILKKTGAGLAYDEELEVLLEDYAAALVDFGEQIDPSKNIVKLTLRHFNPNFYIKDNSRLSMTAGDVDGPIKVLQDKIFRLMGKDDYIIKSLVVDQYPAAEEDIVEIELELLKISSPEYLPRRKD